MWAEEPKVKEKTRQVVMRAADKAKAVPKIKAVVKGKAMVEAPPSQGTSQRHRNVFQMFMPEPVPAALAHMVD
jgi:hypothetical protein